jgi:hypothetical protein
MFPFVRTDERVFARIEKRACSTIHKPTQFDLLRLEKSHKGGIEIAQVKKLKAILQL